MKNPNWSHRIDWGQLERERAKRYRRTLRELAAMNRRYEKAFLRLQSMPAVLNTEAQDAREK